MSVILAAHGAGDDSEANRKLVELAETLRARRPGVHFGCAFWRGTPSFQDAARSLRDQGPTVVPIMTSDGYYARRRLPEELAKGDPSRSFVIAPPIGTLEAFPRVLATKVVQAVTGMVRRRLSPTVLLVGHGTTRVRSSGDVTRWVRDELALALPDTEIVAAFLDESPHLADVAASVADRPVVAVPLLLGGGPHVTVDLVRALTQPRGSSCVDAAAETLKVLPPVLDWPELPALALEAMDSVARRPMSQVPDGLMRHALARHALARHTRAGHGRAGLGLVRQAGHLISVLDSASGPPSGWESGGHVRSPASVPLRAGSPSVP